MVLIADDRAVREAFSRVKNDIRDLKRSINRNIFSTEKLSKELQATTTKDEFNLFLKSLANKLDSLESAAVDKKAIDTLSKDIQAKLKDIDRDIRAEEDFTEDLRSIRGFKTRLQDLKDSSVAKKDFAKEVDDLQKQLAEVRKQLSREATLKKYIDQLTSLKGELAQLDKAKVSWAAYSSNIGKLDQKIQERFKELREVKELAEQTEAEQGKLERLKKQLQSTRDEVAKLQEQLRTVKGESADRNAVANVRKAMEADLDALRRHVDETTEEIDLSDFVTQKQLEDAALRQSEAAEKAARDAAVASAELRSGMKRLQRTQDEFVSHLRSLATSADVKAELDALRQEIRGIKREARKPKQKGPSVYRGLRKAFVDFFTEEAKPQPEKPPQKEEPEPLPRKEERREEKKKENGTNAFVFAAVVTVILVALGLAYLVFAPGGWLGGQAPTEAGEALPETAEEMPLPEEITAEDVTAEEQQPAAETPPPEETAAEEAAAEETPAPEATIAEGELPPLEQIATAEEQPAAEPLPLPEETIKANASQPPEEAAAVEEAPSPPEEAAVAEELPSQKEITAEEEPEQVAAEEEMPQPEEGTVEVIAIEGEGGEEISLPEEEPAEEGVVETVKIRSAPAAAAEAEETAEEPEGAAPSPLRLDRFTSIAAVVVIVVVVLVVLGILTGTRKPGTGKKKDIVDLDKFFERRNKRK